MKGKFKQMPRTVLAAWAALGLGMAGPAWAQEDFATTYSATYNRYAYIDSEPTPLILYEAGGGPVQGAAFTASQAVLPRGGGASAPTGRPVHWASAALPAPIDASPQRAPGQVIGSGTGGGAARNLGPGGPTRQSPPTGPGMPGSTAPPGAAAAPGTGAPADATAPPGAAPAAPPGGGVGAAAAPAATFSPGLGGAPSAGGGLLNMIGDQSPLVSIRQRPVPPPPPPGTRSLLAPSVRGFKIAENQSPIPQDRVFYSFNYFEDVNKKLNDFFDAPIDNLKIYRHVFGLEKTFNEGKGSLGARLPLNTIHADSREANLNQGGTSTALGNLTIFGKYVVESNPRTGNLFSVGLSITPRTAGRRFAGAQFLGSSNTTTIQPFLAYYLNLGSRAYLHGFTSLDVPTDFTDVTILYNDVGLGYLLLRDQRPGRFLTTVAPTVEAHVSTPLNHRGEYNFFDRSGSPDIFNITTGLNLEFYRRSVLTLGIVTPLTGPRPFDFEAVVLFNLRFGGARNRTTFPQIGG